MTPRKIQINMGPVHISDAEMEAVLHITNLTDPAPSNPMRTVPEILRRIAYDAVTAYIERCADMASTTLENPHGTTRSADRR